MSKPLFIFEMANNHMGDAEHGVEMIREYSKFIKKFPGFDFAFKFQYRDLDTFIHDSFKDRTDLHYIKRFKDTRIDKKVFDLFRDTAKSCGFKLMCTPFDNASVSRIYEEGFDIMKVASCSCSDWPLLEEIAKFPLPVIASTGGASELDVDRLYNFFTHKGMDLTILHCVPQYPTVKSNSHLGQISYMAQKYDDINIGFSTHEDPADTTNVQMAIAQGSRVFEKHVGLPTNDYSLNKYSSNPDQVEAWLLSAEDAFIRFGESLERMPIEEDVLSSLKNLERGLFATKEVKKGELLTMDNFTLAFPPSDGQVRAKDVSKFNSLIAMNDISVGEVITFDNCKVDGAQEVVRRYAEEVKALLRDSKVTLPNKIDIELSHHYGLEKFEQFGLTLIDVVNRDYCKKILVSLPNQVHPEQYHKEKEETFIVLHGSVKLYLDGELKILEAGDMMTVLPGVRHRFVSEAGSVIEEISTTHIKNDSYYTDESIMSNANRKTKISDWF